MEWFRIDGSAEHTYHITVDAVSEVTPAVVKTLIDIDLQTFAEPTISPYSAAVIARNGMIFLLQADGVAIGTCVVLRCFDRPQEVVLLTMGIRPGWRGRGLGQKFVSGVLDRIRDQGFRAACLMVGAANRRAVRVYRDVGFEIVESIQADPQGTEPMLMMRMKLQDEAPVRELPPARRESAD